LTTRTAYRYPHPGVPKGREGCMGGTWRHTKEAIGYGPGRLMWIDGKSIDLETKMEGGGAMHF